MFVHTAQLQLLGLAFLCGCSTSSHSSQTCQDHQEDLSTRLDAVEIRLQNIDERLAVIQAYVSGTYVVTAGDTAAKIADRLGLSLAELEKMNPTVQWNRLRVGQRIKIVR